ncbi:STY4851/ECs_5259 family protein [Viridibacterium curvum]|uniref:Uncharacterized protein n=1 Tax=Viridibacterium curvum TaxID=1101404 RepID=A0ABP9R8B2_9RHOO
MSSQAGWLQGFFGARGLQGADKRMLYAYRLKGDEFATLADSLRESLAAASFEQLATRSTFFCAQFVLFASEWWHREYRGGAWRWDPIFHALGYLTAVDANKRTTCVERGLGYWKHRPSGVGKMYFGAIVAHGGLPLKALGQGTGKLSGILLHALRLAARYGWGEEQLVDVVRERAASLPDSLRHEEIYLLLAQMVLTALELRREFRLEAGGDVLATLQRHDPAWMDRFPISLEESAAKPLLADLVKEAVLQQPTSGGRVFSLERTLFEGGSGGFRLRATLRTKRNVTVEELAQSFRLAPEKLPSFFSIDPFAELADPWLSGRLVLGHEGAVRLDGADRVLPESLVCDEVCLVLRHRASIVSDGPIPVPGGAALSSDLPWVFAERDGTWSFLAQGGARLPDRMLRVAVAEGWIVEPADASSSVLSCGRLASAGAEQMQREVFAIEGSATLTLADQVYLVRCGQSARLSEMYSWEGRRLPWQPARMPAFRGVPKLYRIMESGEALRVPTSEIIWREAGSGRALDAHAARGIVDAIVVQSGETCARFRMLILSEGATIEFGSGSSIQEGRVRLKGFDAPNVACLSCEVTARVVREAEASELHLRSNGGAPPESIRVSVGWGAAEAVFALPFPSSGGRFFDPQGTPMRDRERLVLSALSGIRLRIFDQNPSAPKQYSLHLALLCNERSGTGSLSDEIRLQLPENGLAEFRLIDFQRNIEALIGFTSDLDAYVRVSLRVGGKVMCVLDVARYVAGLEGTTERTLRIPDEEMIRLSSDDLRSICMFAAPLTSPVRESVSLVQSLSEGVPTGAWSMEGLKHPERFWLVFPGREAIVPMRPALWIDADRTEVAQRCSLGAAMGLADQTERRTAIELALGEMCNQFEHPSWRLFEYLCSTLSHLPLGTLDVFHVLAGQPQFAAAVALRAQHDDIGSLCRRLGSEMGFVWELTSPTDWLDALRSLQHHSRAQFADGFDVVFPILLKDRCDKLREALPSISLLFDLVVFEGCGESTDAMRYALQSKTRSVEQIAAHMLKGEGSLLQTILLRNHADDAHWPEQWFFKNKAWDAIAERATGDVGSKLKAVGRAILWIPSKDDFKLTVVNMPALLAMWTVFGVSREWWRTEANRLALRKIRAFDPEWFKQAYQQALIACLAASTSPAPGMRRPGGRDKAPALFSAPTNVCSHKLRP